MLIIGKIASHHLFVCPANEGKVKIIKNVVENSNRCFIIVFLVVFGL